MSSDSSEPRERQITGDRETIRQWADEHDAVPVRGPRSRPGRERYRLVPEERVRDDQERVDWDTFFDHVDEEDHVVAYHDDRTSEPFEVTRRDDVITQTDEDIEERLLAGETVTTEVTETRVIESVVTEEISIDSELVGSEVLDYEVVDVELLEREVTNVTVVEDEGADARDWFDADRYVDSLIDRRAGRERTETAVLDRDVPFHVEFDVDERWTVTMDLVERFDVESRITDTDVSEADTLEDHDIDVTGLHRSIAESGIIGEDHTPEEVITHYEIESELAETDRIATSFTRERTVEDEVLDRKHLEADVTTGEILEMETVSTRDVETRTIGTEEDVAGDETAAGATAGTGTAEVTSLDEDAVGKNVVDARGEEIGMVTDVTDNGSTVMVDTHPGIADRIMAVLGWGDSGDEDYPLQADHIDRVTDDEIRLQGEEHLDEADRRD